MEKIVKLEKRMNKFQVFSRKCYDPDLLHGEMYMNMTFRIK